MTFKEQFFEYYRENYNRPLCNKDIEDIVKATGLNKRFVGYTVAINKLRDKKPEFTDLQQKILKLAKGYGRQLKFDDLKDIADKCKCSLANVTANLQKYTTLYTKPDRIVEQQAVSYMRKAKGKPMEIMKKCSVKFKLDYNQVKHLYYRNDIPNNNDRKTNIERHPNALVGINLLLGQKDFFVLVPLPKDRFCPALHYKNEKTGEVFNLITMTQKDINYFNENLSKFSTILNQPKLTIYKRL